MKLIIGLGNPGDKYTDTRHNLGYVVVDQLLKDYEPVDKTKWDTVPKLKSDIVQIDWQPKQGKAERVILAKPTTYMNNSGMAVSLIRDYYKIASEDIWIVYFKLDLPLGSMKIRLGGAAAGHKGVESIIAALGTDKFWRFRLGIGEGQVKQTVQTADGEKKRVTRQKVHHVEEFVLGKFSTHEKGKLKEIIKTGSKALEIALGKGLKTAQNRYNTT